MEASGDIVANVANTFVVHKAREALNDYPLGLYDVTAETVTFEPDREIARTVHGRLNLGHVPHSRGALSHHRAGSSTMTGIWRVVFRS